MYNNLFTYVFFVYPALNPFKYPPPDLMGLEKGLSEKFAEQKICNT